MNGRSLRATTRSLGVAVALCAVCASACEKSRSDSTTPPPGNPTPGEAAVANPAAPQPAPTGPISDQLLSKSGGNPVLFVLGKQGVRAVTASGKTVAVLVDQPLREGGYGAYSEGDGVYWYVDQAKLYAIDLREEVASPVLVADKLPERTFIHIRREIPRPGTFTLSTSTMVATPKAIADPEKAQSPVTLVWATTPGAEMGELHLVGAQWLTAQAERPMTNPKSPEWERSIDGMPGLDEDFRQCEDPDWCTGARAFGASGWDFFVARFGDCEDGCKWTCLLFDPSTKKVALPTAKPTWSSTDDFEAPPAEPYRTPGTCGPFVFDPTGKYYFLRGGDAVCEIGVGCTDMGGTVAGFLRSGTMILAAGNY